MDRMSMFSDDLLLKILSMVQQKDAVTTSLLSKRWYSLWTRMPKLCYEDPTHKDPSTNTEYWRSSRFVDKLLLLHEAPVLESLNLLLGRNCPPSDIETWIRIAVSRRLRHLYIFRRTSAGSGLIQLPRSLYTCETLLTLFLQAEFIVDNVPLTNCFRSLKLLVLVLVKFSNDEIVDRFISSCPVLKELILIRGGSNDNVKTFTISLPSLLKLTILDWNTTGSDHNYVPGDDDVGFVINAPFLKSLTIVNKFNWCYSLVKMPYLLKADIKLRHGDSKMFKGCLNSVKYLFLCLQPPMDSYPLGDFNQLVSLNLCTCSSNWCRLILKHTPKLRALRFKQRGRNFPNGSVTFKDLHTRCYSKLVSVQNQWEQPSSVPLCLTLSLETVEWIGYQGTQVEKEVVMYLLENSVQLKTMAIRSLKSTQETEKLKMVQELASIQRCSRNCRLLFT